MVLLIALLHGLPVLFVGWTFGSRSLAIAMAIVMSLVGVLTGGTAYALLDLAAVWGAYLLASRWLKTALPPEHDGQMRSRISEFIEDLWFVLLWGSIAGWLLWVVVRPAHAESASPAIDPAGYGLNSARSAGFAPSVAEYHDGL